VKEARRYLIGTSKSAATAGLPNSRLRSASIGLAESAGKVIIENEGISPEHVHDLAKLSRQLPDGHPFKQRIAALNGTTRAGHIDPCEHHLGIEPLDRSLERMAGAFELLAAAIPTIRPVPDGSPLEGASAPGVLSDLPMLSGQEMREDVAVGLAELIDACPDAPESARVCLGRCFNGAARAAEAMDRVNSRVLDDVKALSAGSEHDPNRRG